jgi:hypothetical protein
VVEDRSAETHMVNHFEEARFARQRYALVPQP